MDDQAIDLSGNPVHTGPIDLSGNPISIGPVANELGKRGGSSLEIPPDARSYARYIPSALPAIGGTLGGISGGPIGAGAGAGLGASVEELLRSFAPDKFGEGAQTGLEAAGHIGTEAVLNGLLPEGLSKVFAMGPKGTAAAIASKFPLNKMPAVRAGVAKELSNTALKSQFPESQILESAAENASGTSRDFAESYQNALREHQASDEYGIAKDSGKLAQLKPSQEMMDISEKNANTFNKNTVGQQLLNLQRQYEAGEDVAGSQTYKSIANTALSDIQHVRNWKLATGEPKTIEQLALNKLITKGFDTEKGTIAAKNVINELGGSNKEIYQEAISPETMKNFKGLMGEIDKQESGHEISNAVVRWSKGHLMWTIPAAATGLGGGVVGHVLGPLGAASGATVALDSMLGRLMSNPETAQLVTKALKTGVDAPEAGLVNRLLTHAIGLEASEAATPEK